MRQPLLALALATGLLGLGAAPAAAIGFGGSSTTGKTVFSVPFRTGTPDGLPVGVNFGFRPIFDLNSALGPSRLGGTGFEDAGSALIDADLSLSYNFTPIELNLGPLGKVAPRVSPFIGYRYLGAPTLAQNLTPVVNNATAAGSQDPANAAGAFAQAASDASNAKAILGYSQYGGLHLGSRATADLPFNIRAQGLVGLTSLMSGGWDRREASFLGLLGGFVPGLGATEGAQVKAGGTMLPVLSLGASWNPIPFFGLSIGYDLLILPTDMRLQGANQAALTSRRTTVNTINLGIQVLNYQF